MFEVPPFCCGMLSMLCSRSWWSVWLGQNEKKVDGQKERKRKRAIQTGEKITEREEEKKAFVSRLRWLQLSGSTGGLLPIIPKATLTYYVFHLERQWDRETEKEEYFSPLALSRFRNHLPVVLTQNFSHLKTRRRKMKKKSKKGNTRKTTRRG